MNDKRKEHRLKAALAVTLKDGKGLNLAARTSNISRLGAFIETARQVAVGTAAQLTLSIPPYPESSGGGEVKAQAAVFRCAPLRGQQEVFGMGVFFTGFDSKADQARLSAYIDYLARQEDLGIKQELQRRKSKTPRVISSQSAGVQRDAGAQCLDLLQDISRRLDDLSAQIKDLKKK